MGSYTMIVNRNSLIAAAPIKNMLDHKISNGVVTSGMSEAGYDIRIKQTVRFMPNANQNSMSVLMYSTMDMSSLFSSKHGNFTLASAIEEFDMPHNMIGIVHDKSTWARKGLSVFNTVIENGWKGFLTLELVYHGQEELIIPAGSGIAQVVFHQTTDLCQYTGRYQNQPNEPVSAKNMEE